MAKKKKSFVGSAIRDPKKRAEFVKNFYKVPKAERFKQSYQRNSAEYKNTAEYKNIVNANKRLKGAFKDSVSPEFVKDTMFKGSNFFDYMYINKKGELQIRNTKESRKEIGQRAEILNIDKSDITKIYKPISDEYNNYLKKVYGLTNEDLNKLARMINEQTERNIYNELLLDIPEGFDSSALSDIDDLINYLGDYDYEYLDDTEGEIDRINKVKSIYPEQPATVEEFLNNVWNSDYKL